MAILLYQLNNVKLLDRCILHGKLLLALVPICQNAKCTQAPVYETNKKMPEYSISQLQIVLCCQPSGVKLHNREPTISNADTAYKGQ